MQRIKIKIFFEEKDFWVLFICFEKKKKKDDDHYPGSKD